MLHIHVRDEAGAPTWRPEFFERVFLDIRRHCPEVILVASTSGRTDNRLEHRAAVLDLDGRAKPDMASLTLGSLNFPHEGSLNAPGTIQALLEKMRARGIRPELEVFEIGMLNYAFHLSRKDLLDEPCYVNLILGSLGTVPGRMHDLCALVHEIPSSWTWAAAGIGTYQLPVNAAALVMGGHVRVGLEDNLYMDFGKKKPATNRLLVERVARIAGELGRPIARPAEVREWLELISPPT